MFEKGEFQRAYSLLTGVGSLPDRLQNDEQFKAACLFWMGRLSEAESLCAALIEKSRTQELEAILGQIPNLRRAQAGYLSEREKRNLPTLNRSPQEAAAEGVVLRGTCRCYHCLNTFNVHNLASIISPLPFLNPMLCPYCFRLNRVFLRSFGCPRCHGRLNVNVSWDGQQLACPWCRELFEPPDDADLVETHDRDAPFTFPGRSTDPSVSTPAQEAALKPMRFKSIREVERQLLGGKLPPWSACFRGKFDIERPLTQVASDYFCLRRHFDPCGSYSLLAGKLAWLTAPSVGLSILGVNLIVLEPLAAASEPVFFLFLAAKCAAYLALLTTPVRLAGSLLEHLGARSSGVVASLLLTIDRLSSSSESVPAPVARLISAMFLPTASIMAVLAAVGASGRGSRMAFTALAYAVAVWPVKVALGLINLRRRRRVLWDVEQDDGFPFVLRPFSLEGLWIPDDERMGKLLRFLL